MRFSIRIRVHSLHLCLLCVVFGIIGNFCCTVYGSYIHTVFAECCISCTVIDDPLPQLHVIILLCQPGSPAVCHIGIPRNRMPQSILHDRQNRVILFGRCQQHIGSGFRRGTHVPFDLRPAIGKEIFRDGIAAVSFQ